MNEADVDFVITHPEGYELAPEFVRGARVEYDQMKAFKVPIYISQKLGLIRSKLR
jgi:N-succinyl-L-ornithine transcarbamylase